MKFDMDYVAHHNKLTNVNANFKIIFALAVMIFTLCLDNLIIDCIVFILMAILIMGVAGISYRNYLKFITIPFLFTLITCVYLVFFFGSGTVIYDTGFFGIVVTENSLHTGIYTFFRVFGCFSCLGFLALTTPIAEILHFLAVLKVPKLLIDLGLLMYNIIFIFLNQLDTMLNAQKTRLGLISSKSAYNSLGLLFSTLFIKSLDKSETLQCALDSRCYTGEMPIYKPKKR